MWRNDTKCKYMSMFPLKILACKGLTMELLQSCTIDIVWSVKTLFISGPVFYLCLSKVPSNERRLYYIHLRLHIVLANEGSLYIGNIFSHWLWLCSGINRNHNVFSQRLRPCTDIDRKQTQVLRWQTWMTIYESHSPPFHPYPHPPYSPCQQCGV